MDINNITKAAENASGIANNFFRVLFPFAGLKRDALEVYIKDIEKSDKPKELKAWEIMHAKREFKKIQNVSNILELAEAYCSGDGIKCDFYSADEEWYDRFMDSAELVSEEKIQIVWAKLLASKIKGDNRIPRSLIRILSEMDAHLAESFTTLCEHRLAFVGLDSNDVPIEGKVFIAVSILGNNDLYTQKGLSEHVYDELEALGLVVHTGLGFQKDFSGANKVLVSDGNNTKCIVTKDTMAFMCGNLKLTDSGLCLLRCIDPPIASDQLVAIEDYYSKFGFNFDDSNNMSLGIQGDMVSVRKG